MDQLLSLIHIYAEVATLNGKVVGAANVGQMFTQDIYFWGRPSAGNYTADASGLSLIHILMILSSCRLEISVPSADGSIELSNRTGIFLRPAGAIQKLSLIHIFCPL